MKAALIGRSLEHSISPKLHQLLWPHLRGDCNTSEQISYDAISLRSADEAAEWFRAATEKGFRFANVTIPYKSIAQESAQLRTEQAERAMVSNVLRFGDHIIAHNTDGLGFLAAMRRELGGDDLGKFDWVIFGAGGAAHGVVAELSRHFTPRSITLVARNPAARLAFGDVLSTWCPSSEILTRGFGESLQQDRGPRLYLQATPLGQLGGSAWDPMVSGFHEDDLAIDLVYNPHVTEFIQAAEQAGARTLGGLGMLIEQAALSQVFALTGEALENSPLSDAAYHSLIDQLTPQLG